VTSADLRSLPIRPGVAVVPGERAHPPVNRLVQGAFYTFIASVAFEIPNRTIPMEVPTLMGAVFLLTTVLQPGLCYERLPMAFWWFLAYLGVFAASLLVNGLENGERVVELSLHLIQGGMIFLAAFNLMRREEIARRALGTLVVASLLSAALPFLGVGRTAKVVWTGGERLTAFGQNPNQRALILTGGLLALFGLVYGPRRRSAALRLAGVPAAALLLVGLVHTGSRGGTLATLVGLATFALAPGRRRFKNLGIMLVGMGSLVWVVSTSEVMRNRLHPTAGVEALAGRERIFPALLQMFVERPALGWGPINNQYELAIRLNERHYASRDAHNLVLELMTSVGVAGTLAFVIGLALCALAAWRGRRGPIGVLPLAMLVAQLTANMSSTFLANKLFWVVLGFAVAAGSTTAEVSQPVRPALPRRPDGRRPG
jgi:O-antigen ligase